MPRETPVKPAADSHVRIGDLVEIRALQPSGEAYRWWTATVEMIREGEVVVTWPAGTVFAAPTPSGMKIGRYRCRGYYWLDRPYNVAEAYAVSGEPAAIFADIASPARIEGNRITYTDYQLDVVKVWGRPASIEDEDEFLDAAAAYGYSPDFQEECRRTVEDVRKMVDSWVPSV